MAVRNSSLASGPPGLLTANEEKYINNIVKVVDKARKWYLGEWERNSKKPSPNELATFVKRNCKDILDADLKIVVIMILIN